jgi:hypothetical protein
LLARLGDDAWTLHAYVVEILAPRLTAYSDDQRWKSLSDSLLMDVYLFLDALFEYAFFLLSH